MVSHNTLSQLLLVILTDAQVLKPTSQYSKFSAHLQSVQSKHVVHTISHRPEEKSTSQFETIEAPVHDAARFIGEGHDRWVHSYVLAVLEGNERDDGVHDDGQAGEY